MVDKDLHKSLYSQIYKTEKYTKRISRVERPLFVVGKRKLDVKNVYSHVKKNS